MRRSLQLALAMVIAIAPSARAEEDEVRAGVLVRGDTDGTTVVSPSARARIELLDEQTHVDVEYTADIWSSASIDIRTAATMVVEEQRDELNAGLDRRIDDFLVRGGYRFSIENDYEAHGGVLSGSLDLADHNTTLELRLSAEFDSIGRSGDELFQREQTVLGARASYTQVIDPNMLVQFAYELSHHEGFQSSPYRFVGIGGDGTCGGTAQLCVPEAHPNVRTRHALVARGRRAFDDHVSAHLDYRFYVDDWGIVANTAAVQVNWRHDDDGLFAIRYRFHHQLAASFYLPRYPMPAGTLLFVTRDRELSTLWTHRLAVSYERGIELGEAGPRMRIGGSLGGVWLGYQEFVGLEDVFAIDATLSLGVEL